MKLDTTRPSKGCLEGEKYGEGGSGGDEASKKWALSTGGSMLSDGRNTVMDKGGGAKKQTKHI